MKLVKYFFAVCLVGILSTTVGHSQELGIRLGNALGSKNSVAIDGVFGLGEFKRIHADVSFGNGVAVEALWDFLDRPIPDTPFNWYVGAGPSLYLSSPFGFGLAGEAGVEFRSSEIPLVVGLDLRPTLVLIEKTDFVAGFGLNVRYIFK